MSMTRCHTPAKKLNMIFRSFLQLIIKRSCTTGILLKCVHNSDNEKHFTSSMLYDRRTLRNFLLQNMTYYILLSANDLQHASWFYETHIIICYPNI